jgi:RHS repeat-associated protein
LTVTLPDGRIIDYVYDPLGRRIAKKIDGVIVEKYLWQGLTQLLAVYDGSNNLLMRFEYADSRMPMAMTKGGTTYYLTYDQVGSLRVVADASSNVIKRIDYDSFGNIIDDTDPLFEVPFGFAGGLHDKDTGLVRFGFRDYYPDTGRWTAKDQILFAGGDTDLYGYCLNDPIIKVDLTGEAGATGVVIGAIAGAYGGFLSGIQSGNVWTSIAAGAVGGFVGGMVGIVAPQLGRFVGGIAGGILGGALGGAFGKAWSSPCVSAKNIAWASGKGAGIGALTGAIGGGLGAVVETIAGAGGAALDVTTAMTAAPIGWGVGMIDF